MAAVCAEDNGSEAVPKFSSAHCFDQTAHVEPDWPCSVTAICDAVPLGRTQCLFYCHPAGLGIVK